MNKLIKALFCSIVSMSFAMTLNAQTLDFSQVLLMNSTTNVTVPANKVWKITSILPGYPVASNQPNVSNTTADCTSGRYQLCTFYINDVSHSACDWHDSGGNEASIDPAMPIWLPAGTTLRVACADAQISIIEFSTL